MPIETGSPPAFSSSPWSKNSLKQRSVHATVYRPPFERLPRSAVFIATLSASCFSAPPSARGAAGAAPSTSPIKSRCSSITL